MGIRRGTARISGKGIIPKWIVDPRESDCFKPHVIIA